MGPVQCIPNQFYADNRFGEFTNLNSGFSYDHGTKADNNDWRMDNKMNPGGPLFDIGVYLVQSAFYSTNMIPISVEAKNSTKRNEIFRKIPEFWNWNFKWPNGVKSYHSSNYSKYENFLRLNTPKGKIEIKPAYSYQNLSGFSPNGKMEFTHIFQQKKQIDGQCMAILKREANITPGEMGRRDIYVLNSIIEASETNKAVNLKRFYT